MLRFFGRGSAFADTQNCAFFTAGSELVLLDCPMSAFHRLRKLEFPQTQITVVVTHTHGDHIGGIPMLIALSQFVWKKPVTVIAPDQTVADDLKFFIERLDGGDPDAYTLLTADAAEREWLCGAVPVRHVPGLAGRCYGYRLRIASWSRFCPICTAARISIRNAPRMIPACICSLTSCCRSCAN